MPLIEKKLTIKQQAFADAYIELGNATEAYIKAGYKATNRTVAEANARKLLGNYSVDLYIKRRMEELKTERIADQTEVMELLTDVLRGKTRSAALVGVGGGEETLITNMPPTTSERIRAAELIGKRYALFTDKQEVNANVTPIFVDDISGDNNGS